MLKITVIANRGTIEHSIDAQNCSIEEVTDAYDEFGRALQRLHDIADDEQRIRDLKARGKKIPFNS